MTANALEALDLGEVAFEAAPCALVLCDENGGILLVNRALERLFGYRAAELAGRPIDSLVPVDTRSVESSDPLVSDGWHPTPPGAVRSGRRRDGTRIPIEVETASIERGGRRMWVAAVIDLGDRLERESHQRAASDERLQFERLISELVVRFVSTSAESLDETIIDSQRRICEHLDLDRSAVWQFSDDDAGLSFTHVWLRPGAPALPPNSTHAQFPWSTSVLRSGIPVWNATLDDVPDPVDREHLRQYSVRSIAILPLSVDGRVLGAVSFACLYRERTWTPEIRDRLSLVSTVFAQALGRRKSEERSQKELVDRLRRRLARQAAQVGADSGSGVVSRPIAADSIAVRAVLEQIESVAPTHATVLLTGETGAGKEVFAQAIHDLSDRRGRAMVRVNCAAIPAALIESELFGREAGAYTGALSRQIGRFELAEGTTLFLDEIGELPLESQVKLLRVVQDRVVERLGSARTVHVDVRLIAATNRDLPRAVADRTFREDLYYRLNVFPIRVPPLRERLEDIPVLVWTFIEEFSTAIGKRIESISKDSLEALQRHDWPGNVRELRNLIERAVILSAGPVLRMDVPAASSSAAGRQTLVEVEATHIREVLEQTGWRVRGRRGAAELLGMKATTLDSRMVKLGIHRPPR